MIRTLFGVTLLCTLCGACSSSTSDAAGAGGNAGSAGNGSCPDVSGAWDVSEHCDQTLIGRTLQVMENACALSFAAPFDQFSGSVAADGKITLSGPQSCTGTATANAVSMNCTPGTCVVKLSR